MRLGLYPTKVQPVFRTLTLLANKLRCQLQWFQLIFKVFSFEHPEFTLNSNIIKSLRILRLLLTVTNAPAYFRTKTRFFSTSLKILGVWRHICKLNLKCFSLWHKCLKCLNFHLPRNGDKAVSLTTFSPSKLRNFFVRQSALFTVRLSGIMSSVITLKVVVPKTNAQIVICAVFEKKIWIFTSQKWRQDTQLNDTQPI